MMLIKKIGGDSKREEIPKEERPSRLYHYCSVDSFKNIIESKQIWLCDSRSLNDYRENTWILNHIRNVQKELESDWSTLKPVLDNFDLNSPIPFISAFSINGDLLSQWRAYAADGQGVAMGIDPSALGIPFALPMTSDQSELTIGISPVVYDQDFQRQVVYDTLVNAIELLKSAEREPGNIHIGAAIHLRQMAFVFKNDAFKEECEWRIIHTPFVLEKKENGLTQVLGGNSPIHFRTRGSILIPYFTHSLVRENESHTLVEVVLGPKCPVDPLTMKIFLSNTGFPRVEVTSSNASYR